MPTFSLDAGLDPTLPDVTLTIGGKDRPLAFDMASIVRVEKLTGINLMEGALSNISATALRALLYAALLPAEPELTIEQVGRWITLRNAGVVLRAVIMAWYGSIPGEEDEVAEPLGEALPPEIKEA